MKIYDSMKPIVRSIDIPKLYNTCILEAYKDGELVWREEHHNTTTDFPKNVINKGNFFDSIPNNKLFPLDKFFAGIQLISKQGDATRMTIPSDAEIYACAGDASMNVDNNDLRRGIYNVDSSEPLYGANGRIIGYKHVWNWLDTRGNCPDNLHPFKAVCLTRSVLAVARYDESTAYNNVLDEILATISTTERLAKCQLIDYENECAYFIWYSNSKITVEKYQLDTKQFHVQGVFNDGSCDVTTQIGTTVQITPDTAISDFSNDRSSVSLVNGNIHFLTWNNTTIVDNIIDTSDYSVTSNTYTFDLGSGITIRTLDTLGIVKDGLLVSGGYIWLIGSDNKFYKCNMANVSDVSEPYPMVANNGGNNGVFAELPNGDWIKYSYGQDNVTDGITVNFYHNGKVYGAKCSYNAPRGWGMNPRAVNVTPYGTILVSLPYAGRYGSEHFISIDVLTHYVSTVWNITDDDHYKTAGMDMRCIYIISEEEIT